MDVVIVDYQVPGKLRKIFQVKTNSKMLTIKKEILEPAKVFHPAPTLSDQVGLVGPHRDGGDPGSHLSRWYSRPGEACVRWSDGPSSHFLHFYWSSFIPYSHRYVPFSAKVYEIQDTVEIPGSGNLISLLPPDGILERSPAGPEKEEILGLMMTVMMMRTGMMW